MGAPRIEPGTRTEIGLVNHGLARVIGLATGGRPPNVFTTLARHRRLFRRWLRFAGALMPGGLINRAESELLILRVAANCGCEYERVQHVRLARAAGMSAEEISAVPNGPGDPAFGPRQNLLLRAADELHADRTVGEETWNELAAAYSEPELIEICMLVGHYEMLAMTLNALAVEPDRVPSGPPSRALARAERLLRGRR